ncbi:MAG: hypothetical protein EOO04_16585 [Chitinophagaceae bacterium]|nr:MAG: hypothetical protein EOO04_16585 [Chitinophagaceae bacterium]
MTQTSIPITNINDLRREITRLEAAGRQQSALLKQRFSSPSALFATFLSLFHSSPTAGGSRKTGFFRQDFLGLVSRFVLPLALNKTLFRRSNFLIKALVGVLSQKASNYISKDSVMSVWGKVRSLLNKTGKKQQPALIVTVAD